MTMPAIQAHTAIPSSSRFGTKLGDLAFTEIDGKKVRPGDTPKSGWQLVKDRILDDNIMAYTLAQVGGDTDTFVPLFARREHWD